MKYIIFIYNIQDLWGLCNMKNDFIIGCNYWASNAGTEMWRNFSEEAIRGDLKILSENGIKYMRVFPNWRDFQPVIPVYTPSFSEYMLEGDVLPTNKYFLDKKMLDEFSIFCDICEEYNIKLIVGLITGWMSGRLFLPPVLYGKNLFNDPEALMLEGYMIKGFVNALKHKKAIYAWDLGNECNCLCECKDRHTAVSWTAFVANAIKAEDSTRPLFSGMHGIKVSDFKNVWTINDQAEYCDMLTTHPYPYFVEQVFNHDKYVSLRTTMHASCETKYYSDLGEKPCFMEEIGTLGPMLCDDETASKFARLNFFSGWANGSKGMMWWCANDQTNLRTVPYTRNMCETELGMIRANKEPKPVLKEFKRFSDFMDSIDFTLPSAMEDAVCILSKNQDQWGVAYMSYILAKQAGLNLHFSYAEDKIQKSNVYMLPSVKTDTFIPFEKLEFLKKEVAEGATLYVSVDETFIREFEDLFGNKINMAEKRVDNNSLKLNGKEICFSRDVIYHITPTRAEVIATDCNGNPAITKAKYKKGYVYFVNFPLEAMLLKEDYAFEKNRHEIYSQIFKDVISSHRVTCDNPNLAMTLHEDNENLYAVIVNHTEKCEKTNLKVKDGACLMETIYGNADLVDGFDASVLKFSKVK